MEGFKSQGRILYLILKVNGESLEFTEEWARRVRPVLLGNLLWQLSGGWTLAERNLRQGDEPES